MAIKRPPADHSEVRWGVVETPDAPDSEHSTITVREQPTALRNFGRFRR